MKSLAELKAIRDRMQGEVNMREELLNMPMKEVFLLKVSWVY